MPNTDIMEILGSNVVVLPTGKIPVTLFVRHEQDWPRLVKDVAADDDP
ncbi:hypothetical protein ACFWZ4_14375 [Frateuria sp. GZRe12]